MALLGGTAGAQLIGLVTLPLLARLFSPAAFGPFAVVQSLLIPASIVANLRLDLAIPLPRMDREAVSLVRLGARSAAFVGGLVLVVLVVARYGFSVDLPLGPLLLWVPVIGALAGCFALLNQLAIRRRAYRAIAVRTVVQALVTAVLQVGAGLAGAGPHGLAAGLAGGQLVGVLTLLVAVRRVPEDTCAQSAGTETASRGPDPRTASARTLLGRYRQFPLVLAPSGVLNAAGLALPLIVVTAFYGTEVSGWFGLTQRVLLVPLALVGASVSQVFLGEFGHAARQDPTGMRALFDRTSAQLAVVGMVVGLILAVAGPWLFEVVLGDAWSRSGEYARLMAPAVVAQMVSSPLSQTLVIARKTRSLVAWDGGRLILSGGSIPAVKAAGGSDVTAVLTFSLALALAYAALWVLCRRAAAAASALP